MTLPPLACAADRPPSACRGVSDGPRRPRHRWPTRVRDAGTRLLASTLRTAPLVAMLGCNGGPGGAGSDGIVGNWQLTGTQDGSGPVREYVSILADGTSEWPSEEHAGYAVDVAGDLGDGGASWTFLGAFEHESAPELDFELSGSASVEGADTATFSMVCSGRYCPTRWEFEGERCADADWWRDC